MRFDAESVKKLEQWQIYSMLEGIVKSSREQPQLNWEYALSSGQITSKLWILEALKEIGVTSLGKVMVLGGWIGLLGHILLSERSLSIEKLRSFDIDPLCEEIADSINLSFVAREWKFKASCADCTNLTILKLSSLHFEEMEVWLN